MNEWDLQLISSLKIVAIAIYSYLYGIGGIQNKANRRVFGSLFLMLAVVGFSLWQDVFSYFYLAYAVFLWGSTSIGYGADELKDKLIKRSRYGLLCGLSAIPMAIIGGNWHLFGLYIFTCVLISTVLGAFNITSSARSEETLIGATIATSLFLI